MDAYHVYEQIGTGDRSTIYKARLKKTLHYYAIKRTLKQPSLSHASASSSSASTVTEQQTIDALSYEIVQHLKCLGIKDISSFIVDTILPSPSVTVPYPLPVYRLPLSFTVPFSGSTSGWTHPNILQLYHYSTSVRSLYRVYEYCSGGSLAKVIDQDQGLPEAAIRLFGIDIIKALFYLHSLGFLYGPLRLADILLDENGTLKLTNFTHLMEYGNPTVVPYAVWNSKSTDTAITHNSSSLVVFTDKHLEAYLSPELFTSFPSVPTVHEDSLRSPLSGTLSSSSSSPSSPPPLRSIASDLYSLGVCFYHIATNSLPYTTLDGILNDKVPYPQIPQLVSPSLPTIIEESKYSEESNTTTDSKNDNETKQNSSFDEDQIFQDSLSLSNPTRRGPCSRTFFHLLTRLLDKDPRQRCTWKELLCHPFWCNDPSIDIDTYLFQDDHEGNEACLFSEWVPLYQNLASFPSEVHIAIPIVNFSSSTVGTDRTKESKEEGNDNIAPPGFTKESLSVPMLTGPDKTEHNPVDDVLILDPPDTFNDSVTSNDTIVPELIPLRYSTSYEREIHPQPLPSSSSSSNIRPKIQTDDPGIIPVPTVPFSTSTTPYPIDARTISSPTPRIRALLQHYFKLHTATFTTTFIKPIAATGKPPPLRLSTLPFAPLSIDELLHFLPASHTETTSTTIPSGVEEHLSLISRALQTSEPVITLSILSYIYSLCENDTVSNHVINSSLTMHLLRMLPESSSTTVQARIALLIGRFIQRSTYITPSVIYDHHFLSTLTSYLSSSSASTVPMFHPTVQQHLVAAYCELIFYIATQAHQEPNNAQWYIPSFAVDTIRFYLTFDQGTNNTVIHGHFLQLIANILSLAPNVLFTLPMGNNSTEGIHTASEGEDSLLRVVYATLLSRVRQPSHETATVDDTVPELNHSHGSLNITSDSESSTIQFTLQILYVWLQQYIEGDTSVPFLSIATLLTHLRSCLQRFIDQPSFSTANQVSSVIMFSSLALLTMYVKNPNDTFIHHQIFSPDYYTILTVFLVHESDFDTPFLNGYALLSTLLLLNHQHTTMVSSNVTSSSIAIHDWLVKFPSWMNRLVTSFNHQQIPRIERISFDRLDNSQEKEDERTNEQGMHLSIRAVGTALIYDTLLIGSSMLSSTNDEDLHSLFLDTCTSLLSSVPGVMFLDWIDSSFLRSVEQLLDAKAGITDEVRNMFPNFAISQTIWISEIFRTLAESFEMTLEKHDDARFGSNETEQLFDHYQHSVFPSFIHWFGAWVTSVVAQGTGKVFVHADIYPSLLQSLYQYLVSSPVLVSRMLPVTSSLIVSVLLPSLCELYHYIDDGMKDHGSTATDTAKDTIIIQATIAELLHSCVSLVYETRNSLPLSPDVSVNAIERVYDWLDRLRFPFIDTEGMEIITLSNDKDNDQDTLTFLRSDYNFGLILVRIIDTLIHMTVSSFLSVDTEDDKSNHNRILSFRKLSAILYRILQWWDKHIQWLIRNPSHKFIYEGNDRYTILTILLQNMAVLAASVFRNNEGKDEDTGPSALSGILNADGSLYSRRVVILPIDRRRKMVPFPSVLRQSISSESTASTTSTEVADDGTGINEYTISKANVSGTVYLGSPREETVNRTSSNTTPTRTTPPRSFIAPDTLDSIGDHLTTLVTVSMSLLVTFYRNPKDEYIILVKHALRYIRYVNAYVPIKASFHALFWTDEHRFLHQHIVTYLNLMMKMDNNDESEGTYVKETVSNTDTTISSFVQFLPIIVNFVQTIDRQDRTELGSEEESIMVAYMDVFLSCIRTSKSMLRTAQKYLTAPGNGKEDTVLEPLLTFVDRVRGILHRTTTVVNTVPLSVLPDVTEDNQRNDEIRKPIFIRVRRQHGTPGGIPSSPSASSPTKRRQGKEKGVQTRIPSPDLRKRLELMVKELE